MNAIILAADKRKKKKKKKNERPKCLDEVKSIPMVDRLFQ